MSPQSTLSVHLTFSHTSRQVSARKTLWKVQTWGIVHLCMRHIAGEKPSLSVDDGQSGYQSQCLLLLNRLWILEITLWYLMNHLCQPVTVTVNVWAPYLEEISVISINLKYRHQAQATDWQTYTGTGSLECLQKGLFGVLNFLWAFSWGISSRFRHLKRRCQAPTSNLCTSWGEHTADLRQGWGHSDGHCHGHEWFRQNNVYYAS